MTTNTQHDAAIQEGERIAAADEYFKARTWIMDTSDNRRIFEAGFDRAYALLSKLRAPVAEELKPVAWRVVSADGRIRTTYYEKPDEARTIAATFDGDTIVPMFDHAASQASEAEPKPVSVTRHSDQSVLLAFSSCREASAYERAALASAPVAGEAVATVMTCYGGEGRFYLDAICEKGFKPPPGTKLYAAPQASEAARDAALDACRLVVERFGPTEHDYIFSKRMAIQKCRAALSAQPGAQKGGSDAD